MALYNFQKRFAEAVESGAKTHTIRAHRKRQTKVGETVHLYTGLRQRGARKLGTGICTQVQEIKIKPVRPGAKTISVVIDGQWLRQYECERLAKCDGFAAFKDMLAFWDGRLPFSGEIIHWRLA